MLVSNRVQLIISMLRTLLNLLNSPKVSCILPLWLYSLAFYFYIVDLSELTFFNVGWPEVRHLFHVAIYII